VTYADGSTATITSGAGFCFIDRDKPVAIVGSHLSNGDVIVGSPNETLTINEPEGEPPIPGLLDPTYVPPRIPRNKSGGSMGYERYFIHERDRRAKTHRGGL
jgi:hypothetical protein